MHFKQIYKIIQNNPHNGGKICSGIELPKKYCGVIIVIVCKLDLLACYWLSIGNVDRLGGHSCKHFADFFMATNTSNIKWSLRVLFMKRRTIIQLYMYIGSQAYVGSHKY